MSVRLLTYNIREGGVGRADAIAQVIEAAHPDVVALQEARAYPRPISTPLPTPTPAACLRSLFEGRKPAAAGCSPALHIHCAS